MPKSQSHLLRERAKSVVLFYKRKYGEALALWLNTCADAKAQKEFSDTIEQMNHLTSLNASWVMKYLTDQRASPREQWLRDIREIEEEIHWNTASLILAHARPKLRPGENATFVQNPPAYTIDKRWKLEWHYPDERLGQTSYLGKGRALTCLIALAEEGTLDRMRKCPECSKWLYARFSHQRFCSTKCQQAHYWASPEWKAHRREWMRDYRRNPMRGV
jgi:endogenous inhibitor of DNA gyrase (YacG/DUF329 family)